MTDTLPRQAGAAETAPASAAASSRVDLGDLRVVHTRHWFRWSIGIVVLFVVAQFAWSLVTNENYEWDVFAHYFLSEPVLQGVGITLALTAISATIGFFLGTLLALARLAKSPLLSSAEDMPKRHAIR